MNFQFKVRPTKDFLFQPTDLQIFVGEGAESRVTQDGQEMVRIQSMLTQHIENGTLTETKDHLFPVSVLAAINGFDAEEMKPTINHAVLVQILTPFNLELTP